MTYKWTEVAKTVAFVLSGTFLAVIGLVVTAYVALMAFIILLFTLSPPADGLGIGP